jgi:hypothetical protein
MNESSLHNISAMRPRNTRLEYPSCSFLLSWMFHLLFVSLSHLTYTEGQIGACHSFVALEKTIILLV